METTLIVGATTNKNRYAYLAAEMLHEYGYPFVPLGIKKGTLLGVEILDIRSKPALGPINTITLYIGPEHQAEWYDYLLQLNPKRVIFNPGTENPVFERLLKESGIDYLHACTLVMLRSGQY